MTLLEKENQKAESAICSLIDKMAMGSLQSESEIEEIHDVLEYVVTLKQALSRVTDECNRNSDRAYVAEKKAVLMANEA